MAVKGYVGQLLNSLPSDIRKVLLAVFDYTSDNWRFGLRDNETRAENAQGYRFDGTTNSTAGDEFTIAHNLGSAPYLILPILPLDSSGGTLVPITVSRPADATRMYLKSSLASKAVSFYVEV